MSQDQHRYAIELPEKRGVETAAEKIARTLREMSKPDPGADELALMLATVAMGLERSLGEQLERTQSSGELDEFILGLVRWLATHRSDSADALLVVEVPRRPIPTGRCVALMERAARAYETASSPL